MRRAQDDAGFVAIAFAGLVLVLLSAAVVLSALGAVAVARHRAAAAADLAALAGATHVLEGTACSAAGGVARAQGATLESCSVEDQDVQVTVTVRPAGRLGELGIARARARAGPSSGTAGSAGTS
ncbi:MAG: pilus assembly protein TadE [Frankiales bacterium]|nr:pilus assembly protein TadE [Frankiales bacterium]